MCLIVLFRWRFPNKWSEMILDRLAFSCAFNWLINQTINYLSIKLIIVSCKLYVICLQAENLRKKVARVEDENDSLMMQLKKMATRSRSMTIVYICLLILICISYRHLFPFHSTINYAIFSNCSLRTFSLTPFKMYRK